MNVALELEKMNQPRERVVRKPYERVRLRSEGGGELITDQNPAQDTDVNKIVAKFMRTGTLPPSQKKGVYADVSGLQGDLTEQIIKTQETLKILEEKQKQNEEGAEASTETQTSQQATESVENAVGSQAGKPASETDNS